MPRYHIIVNPVSGRGTGAKSIPTISEYLTNMGVDFDIVQTERPWHAVKLAEDACNGQYDVIVGAGGDGTANEIINGMMSAKQQGKPIPAMAMLSVGRGNDFAFSMGFPIPLDEACKNLVIGKRVPIDVGKVTGGDFPQGRYFGNGIGIGFDAVVGFEALKITWLSGFPSYIIAALKTIFLYFRAPKVQVEIDEKSLELRALMVSVMNGRRMGGGFMMAPDGKKDDGLLNICIAKQVSKMRIFTLIPHFIRGDQATQAEIRVFQGKKITVTALTGSLPAHADGETLCTEGTKLSAEILPRQLEILLPVS